jgi:hypothetical protein
VSFRVYRDRALVNTEQEQVFEGPVWNFLCPEPKITQPWRLARDGETVPINWQII